MTCGGQPEFTPRYTAMDPQWCIVHGPVRVRRTSPLTNLGNESTGGSVSWWHCPRCEEAQTGMTSEDAPRLRADLDSATAEIARLNRRIAELEAASAPPVVRCGVSSERLIGAQFGCERDFGHTGAHRFHTLPTVNGWSAP